MRRGSHLLTVLIFAGLVLGVLVGEFGLYDASATPVEREQATAAWKTAGDLVLIRPLKLLIVPLIFTSVLTGITSIADPKRLGLVGGATLVFYVSTMLLAVAVGVTLATLIAPGVGIPPDVLAAGQAAGVERAAAAPSGSSLGAAWVEILKLMIPENFFQSAVEVQALSVITATILLGVGLTAAGEKSKDFIKAVESLHEALMLIVRWILWLMPVGVFLLVAWAVGKIGLASLAEALGKYVLTVTLGLGIHMVITLPLIMWLLTRKNPFAYLWGMRPALLTAFGTASSMATLPLTIETAAEQPGCSKRSAGIVLPLGATVNMDGTALYQGIVVIFLFQAFGIDLEFTQHLVIVLTATLAAVGAAGIPGGSIATTIIIIGAVNTTLSATSGERLPPEAIGIILGVDRILDMMRTMVNVWGDSVGARIMSRLAPDTEEEREAAFA